MPHLAWPLIPQLQHRTVRYGSVCSGIEAASVAWCERLQGFPDGFTLISWKGKPAEQCPDGPRYKALGNSMAVPVMRWIGLRMHLALTTPAVLEPKP